MEIRSKNADLQKISNYCFCYIIFEENFHPSDRNDHGLQVLHQFLVITKQNMGLVGIFLVQSIDKVNIVKKKLDQ
jgi:hypothetical protein